MPYIICSIELKSNSNQFDVGHMEPYLLVEELV